MKSATKFICVKTSSGKVVATSFYLMVHRWIAGDDPIYVKLSLKVTYPFDLPLWPSGYRTQPPLCSRA